MGQIAGQGTIRLAWTDYDTHARGLGRDDLWGQVRRTVNGCPVPDSQIRMITASIVSKLELVPEDVLLDLACGNGALTRLVQPHCAGSLGVDVSPYLIGVAEERFATPAHRFAVADAAAYTEAEERPERFTKALCYGSLSYLDDAAVDRMLHGIHRRFPLVSRLLLGNLPDPSRADAFFPPGTRPDLHEPRSALGAWRSVDALANLAWPGWRLTASTMPPTFYAAHYRYDALLERVG